MPHGGVCSGDAFLLAELKTFREWRQSIAQEHKLHGLLGVSISPKVAGGCKCAGESESEQWEGGSGMGINRTRGGCMS